jgi:hypothetical protein
MPSLQAVIRQPAVQIGLERFQALIEGGPQFDAEELDEHRPVEPLHLQVRLRSPSQLAGGLLTC